MSPDIYQSSQVTLFFFFFFLSSITESLHHRSIDSVSHHIYYTSNVRILNILWTECLKNVRFHVNDTSRPHEAAVDLQLPCSLWDKIIGFLSELWSEWLRTVSLCIKQENKTAQKNWASLKPKTISSFVQRVQNADSQWNEHKHKHTHTI